MDRKKLLLLSMLACVLLCCSIKGSSMAQAGKMEQDKTMWCDLTNAEFNRLCQNQEFMRGLTPEQKKEIDKEWQRRIPTMTPEEIQMYYPEGRRYYPGGG